jgi:hypothetical protein
MKRKIRQVFLAKYGGDEIEMPAQIKTSLPRGTLLSVSIEYEVESSRPEDPDERYLDALDEVHDSYP